MKPKSMSKSEFARHLNVSPSAVSKALKSSRIGALADGRIDPVSATEQWMTNTDPERIKVKQKSDTGGKSKEKSVISDEAMTKIKEVLAEQGIAVNGPLTIQLARTAETIARIEERQLKLAIKRGEYLPKAKVFAHFNRIAIGIKNSFQNLPSRHAPMIAAELGVDEFKLEQAMRKAIDATLDEIAEPIAKATEGKI